MSICTVMIVKNENTIITRCLDSIKSFTDYLFICDTGSTDNTIQIITDWIQLNNIIGTIDKEPFVNFGYNRTKCIQMAQQVFKTCSYFFLIDADMVITIEPTFKKSILSYDYYYILQTETNLKYWNIRLIKSSLPWECIGVTHEYWNINTDPPRTGQRLTDITINDLSDGSSHSNKYRRDVDLLLKSLDDETIDSIIRCRYYFNLAQTYRYYHEYKLSIKYYKKAIQYYHFPEERFYSLFSIGISYQHINKISKAVTFYHQAHIYRPWRAEPLYYLSMLYYKLKLYDKSIYYLLLSKNITYPINDNLFIEFKIYDYLIDVQICIVSQYVSEYKPLAKQLYKELCLNKKFNTDIIQLLPINYREYIDII